MRATPRPGGAPALPASIPRRYFARWCTGSRHVILVRLRAPEDALALRGRLRASRIEACLTCPSDGAEYWLTVPLDQLPAARRHLTVYRL
jgi:hypothetical protein